MSDTGPESPVPGAASGSGGAAAGEGREKSFEELQKELEDIVARLERGDVAVDDAIALFKSGEELYRACVARLETAELRIEQLEPLKPADRNT
jgi:exodeoxyribonuclease VII small subunit